MVLPGILIFCFALTQAQSNPFKGRPLYVNPSYQEKLHRTIAKSSPSDKKLLEPLTSVSTAFWISERKATDPSYPSDPSTVIGALTNAASQRPVPIVTFVVYNVPNRDCSAEASAGEICCLKRQNGTCNFNSPTCNGGFAEYRTAFVDVIAKTVAEFCNRVPMAFIIEPDSIPNLITSDDNPKCSVNGTQFSLRNGIPYSVRAIAAACPAASIYVDAAHGAWLGWEENAEGYAKEIAAMNIADKIRGFAVNVANYQPLGTKCPSLGFCMDEENSEHPCCVDDPCGLSSSNPGFTELNYVEELNSKMREAIPSFSPHFVIDTARNGVENARLSCSNWCNARGAGLGKKPTSETADENLIDAYLWIKPPGESDGCTQELPDGGVCPRFDPSCESEDSIGSMEGEPLAPEAGEWFEYQIRQYARNSAV